MVVSDCGGGTKEGPWDCGSAFLTAYKYLLPPPLISYRARTPSDDPQIVELHIHPPSFSLYLSLSSITMSAAICKNPIASMFNKPEDRPPLKSNKWSMLQTQKLMSPKSLEMCTENLGSETGSDGFEADAVEHTSLPPEIEAKKDIREKDVFVSYHCHTNRSLPRSFPPPLPSMSRGDGPCLHMRPHRRDGRLVVEAVPVPTQNYLRAYRQDGRLVLSMLNAAADVERPPQQSDEPEEDDDEDEEEVEVVDRGAVVEVKVSTQPQQQSGAMKVRRSSIVINKFVGGNPASNQNRWTDPPPPPPHLPEQEITESHSGSDSAAVTAPAHRRTLSSTTTAAAAAVAASSIGNAPEAAGRPPTLDNKQLFTSNRRNREEVMRQMRRCSELRRPLFFWEPCRIATS